ncbi:MAG: hypothetical protein IJ533_08515 [Prevotella sp.]|nr:hypothetical protein [Prevotella sp.]
MKVKTIHNNFFLGGLVGRQKIVAPEYTMGLTDYKVKNYHSIVDVILQNITAGIYTPTTTEIYLPANYRQPQKADTQK